MGNIGQSLAVFGAPVLALWLSSWRPVSCCWRPDASDRRHARRSLGWLARIGRSLHRHHRAGIVDGLSFHADLHRRRAGTAAALGLGNGAVFKLVPEHFPKETGTVTGLVGAFGGLGGFFPPLVLGVIRDATGGYAIGFVLLALSAVVCLLVNYVVFIRKNQTVFGSVLTSLPLYGPTNTLTEHY